MPLGWDFCNSLSFHLFAPSLSPERIEMLQTQTKLPINIKSHVQWTGISPRTWPQFVVLSQLHSHNSRALARSQPGEFSDRSRKPVTPAAALAPDPVPGSTTMLANNCRGSKDGGLLEVGGAGQDMHKVQLVILCCPENKRKTYQPLAHTNTHTLGQIINATYVTQFPLGQQKVVCEFMLLLRRKLMRSLSRISPTLDVPGPRYLHCGKYLKTILNQVNL